MKRSRKSRMKKTSPAKSGDSSSARPTVGTKVGAELRTATNALSDENRQALRSFGMSLIYGGKGGIPVQAVRR